MKNDEYFKIFNRICSNCGLTYGSHRVKDDQCQVHATNNSGKVYHNKLSFVDSGKVSIVDESSKYVDRTWPEKKIEKVGRLLSPIE